MAILNLYGPDKPWLSASEVAEYLGVPAPAVDILVRRGRLPPGVFGPRGEPRWPALDVACFAYLASRIPPRPTEGEG